MHIPVPDYHNKPPTLSGDHLFNALAGLISPPGVDLRLRPDIGTFTPHDTQSSVPVTPPVRVNYRKVGSVSIHEQIVHCRAAHGL